VNDVVLHLQVLEQELDWQIAVRLDAAHFRGRKNDQGRFFLGEKTRDIRFVPEIKQGSITRHDVEKAIVLELADERAADQAPMAGYEYFV